MNSLYLDASKNFTNNQPFLGLRIRQFSSPSNSIVCFSDRKSYPSVSCSFYGGNRKPRVKKNQRRNNVSGDRIKVKEKENVWSVDNELAKVEAVTEKQNSSRRRKRGGKRVKNVGKREKNSRVMVSGTMLNEVETVLQTQVSKILILFFQFKIARFVLFCN